MMGYNIAQNHISARPNGDAPKFFLIQLIMYAWKLDFVLNVEDGSFIFFYYFRRGWSQEGDKAH